MRFAVALCFFAVASPVFAADDIINYSKEDPRMNAAMAKGVATLADFDAAMVRDRPGLLNVRVPYGDQGKNEYLWLTAVHRNADGSYDGVVTDDVQFVPDLHRGSAYHATHDQVADWIYKDDKGDDHGGWTVRLMRESMSPAQRAADTFHFVD